MAQQTMRKIPVLLMVSGGSDSTALLELAVRYVRGTGTVMFKLDEAQQAKDRLVRMLARSLVPAQRCDLHVLHVNHQLRGMDADDDEEFVVSQCRNLGVPCEVRRVDIAALAAKGRGGIEAVAREERYRLAGEVLDGICDSAGVDRSLGLVCTAHTLDDRVETFYMRSLVGTGPGGLGSIPRRRGRLRRPLLDATREELREYLRSCHPTEPDYALWREDATNDDGSNFRSRIRHELMPVLRDLRPGFEASLARTMDLIASEDAEVSRVVEANVRKNLVRAGGEFRFPTSALAELPRPYARRVIRRVLLEVNPDARLESAQIERVVRGLATPRFSTEVSGGIRIRIADGFLCCSRAQ